MNYEDNIPKRDMFVIGFFESLIILKNDVGDICVSPDEAGDIEVGMYFDGKTVPLKSFSEDFQQIIRDLFD